MKVCHSAIVLAPVDGGPREARRLMLSTAHLQLAIHKFLCSPLTRSVAAVLIREGPEAGSEAKLTFAFQVSTVRRSINPLDPAHQEWVYQRTRGISQLA
jgi:hypothetical protein